MIQELIKEHVEAMTSNSDSFTFVHGFKEFQSVLADDIQLPVVFLDMPIKYTPIVNNSGVFNRRYNLVALFLYRSDIDDSKEEQYIDYTKAEVAQKELHLKLFNDPEVFELSIVGECYQVAHLFDTPLSGVVMPFQFTLKNTDPGCV